MPTKLDAFPYHLLGLHLERQRWVPKSGKVDYQTKFKNIYSTWIHVIPREYR